MDCSRSTRPKVMADKPLISSIALTIWGIVFMAPLASVAIAADPKTVVDQLLNEEINALQNQMIEMSSGCSGKGSGVPPVSWGALQVHGYAAVNAFSSARTALATDKTPVAVQQINAGLGALDSLVNGLHDNCSGGSSGEDPPSYGKYVASRDKLKTELKIAMRFL